MKLLVIVLCLLSERFLIHGVSYQRFSWFAEYSLKMVALVKDKNYLNNPWVMLAAINLPIIFIVSFVYLLFHSVLFGFLGLILSVVIFFYCLGPNNAFYPLTDVDLDGQPNVRVGTYFAEVNSQLFAVLFWYLVGGPIAAVAYRLITLCRSVDLIERESTKLTNVLEWIPARLEVLLFLLVGNFQAGSSLFLHYLLAKPDLNHRMLSECGLQAVRERDSDVEVPMPIAERLVEHATIVLLVFVALITLSAST